MSEPKSSRAATTGAGRRLPDSTRAQPTTKGWGASAWLVAAAAGIASCAPTPVEIDIAFPSRETFLHSEFGRLLVYEVDLADAATGCPTLLDAASSGDLGSPVLSTEWTPVCEFRAGGVRFDSVPPGPHAYVVLARDADNMIIVEGCRVAEAYEGAPPVTVRMFPNQSYADEVQGRTLGCADEEDKCRNGC